MTRYRLFGMPGSLYTAKARSYLIKQHLEVEEAHPADPDWPAVTAAVGRWIIPVLQTPEGDLIQDGAAIIDHVEAAGLARRSAYPETPIHRVVSQLFELFGGEGLLRPAMHFRWDFDEVNRAFLKADFVAALMPGAAPDQAEAVFGAAAGRMRKAKAGFGVSPETAPAIAESYREFLALFDAHLATTPYLLGGRPTIGDYGLIGPLYPHLGRDPYPAQLMKATAYHVWRWVERMNTPQALLDGHAPAGEALIADDAVPDTLKALMAFVGRDYLPELTAHVAFANDWIDAHDGIVTGTNGLDSPGARVIGRARFDWRGHSIETMVMPYRFYLLQRVRDAAGDVPEPAALRALFEEVGLGSLLDLATHRRVERDGNAEVWGPDLRG